MEEIVEYIKDIYQNFLRIIQSITFFDVLDIIILTFLVYYLIKLIRETRAMQLLKGIFFLLIVFALVQIFELKAMGFLIDNFLQVGIIAIFIVFQPELRRILEKVGRTRVSTFTQSIDKLPGKASARSRAISGISEACARLHDSKTGALIVIEREKNLEDVVDPKSVKIIDAECEPELFCNLFFNKAPLHKGAVIIRDNRIYAAGCSLPNAQKDQNPDAAALSISKSSDALVIAVSEKTGIVSIAVDGQMTRDVGYPALKKKLTDIMPAEKKERNFYARKNSDKDSLRNAIFGIANACNILHNRKTGALIVIERNTKLGDIIGQETASIIDAECEPELFCNLFYNKAPLHDGAVIIRDNRIYAAGCFLPNTQSDQYLSSDLGSRHRAALGMSENSDALVIVVSEETGTISVAKDGQLTRDLNHNALLNILQSYMPSASSDKKKNVLSN